MNIEQIKSDLNMRDLHFTECSVKRNAHIGSQKISIDISRDIAQHSENEYEVTVKVYIEEENHDLEVLVVAKATFCIDCADSHLAEKVIRTNTVAIMFPFIRSQISLLTTQPNMAPIVLPPINTMRLDVSEE